MCEAPTGRPSVPPSVSPSVLLHPPPPRATRVRPSAEDSPPVSFSRLSVLSGKIRSIPMPCSRTGACHLGGPHSFVWDPSLLLAGAPSFTAPARSPVPRWSSVAELVCRRAGQCKALRVFRDSSEGLSRHGRGSGAPAPSRGRALCVFAAGPGRGDPSRGEQPENVGHQTRVAGCPPRLMGRARSCDVPHTREQVRRAPLQAGDGGQTEQPRTVTVLGALETQTGVPRPRAFRVRGVSPRPHAWGRRRGPGGGSTSPR